MTLDYRKFLGANAAKTEVLPFFGGMRVDAEKRHYAVTGAPPPRGWASWAIAKREATYVAPADPVDLSRLPALRGHYVHGWVIVDGTTRGRVALPPPDEPAPLSRVTLRTWFSGEHLFDSLDFEDDAEVAARDALEHRRTIEQLKGAAPSLRLAFGLALGMQAAADLQIAMTVTELLPIATMIADQGTTVVRELFDDLVRERQMAIELARLAAERADLMRTVRPVARASDPRTRADTVLAQARARLLAVRAIHNGRRLDVTYEVDGNRIMSIVDAGTLHIIDPGVCLADEHDELTLDAMPSVIREAIRVRHLNITRR